VYNSRAAVPDHKNDHRFGEQKNAPLVRAYLGFERLDTLAPTQAVNVLYDKMWLYYNLFQPVLRLQEKTFVPLEGRLSKVQRHYDQAQTPFDCLCATTAMRAQRREALERLRDRTNPRRLRQEIYDLIDQIAALPCAGAVVSSTRPEGGKQLGDIII
jgi:hypothetical protein